MNQTQLKYARFRAETIHKRALEKLSAAHTTPAIVLSMEERLKAVQAGEFDVISTDNYRLEGNLRFHGERSKTFDQAAYDEGKRVLDKEYHKLLDALVLGEASDALQMLQAFEAANG